MTRNTVTPAGCERTMRAHLPTPDTQPLLPVGVRTVREEFRSASLPIAHHPEWLERFGWLVQGVTARGSAEEPFDLGLFGADAVGAVHGRWISLARELGMERTVVGGQVHGRAVRVHHHGPPGLLVLPDTDGHATRVPGVLLAVSVADCVPVAVLDVERRAVALLHAGWRGAAAGILEEGVGVLSERFGSSRAELSIHFGPAICGACYEVGPEVHEALGLPVPSEPHPVNLRASLALRAVALGVTPDRVTVSAWCTRCGDSPFFSHRGGHGQRQIGFVGVRS